MLYGAAARERIDQLKKKIASEPLNPVLRVRLARVCGEAGEIELARANYEEAIRLAPQLAIAYVEYSRVLAAPAARSGASLRVLQLGSAVGTAHTNTEPILASKLFSTSTIAVEYWDLQSSLPQVDVVLNAISDADACGSALDIASSLLEQTPGLRVINHPAKVRLTGRLSNAIRLSQIPGLIVPTVAVVTREQLMGADAAELHEKEGVTFPLLVRVPGSNNGENLVKVDAAKDVSHACDTLPGDVFLATTFVDTRESDGLTRKYRVMNVAGRLFPIHRACSQHWNVHYTDADASHEAVKEEERFLSDMERALGSGAVRTLHAVFERLGLEYAGIDFGMTADGRVVLYEANATMTIYVPDRFGPESLRRRAAEAVVSAARALVAGA